MSIARSSLIVTAISIGSIVGVGCASTPAPSSTSSSSALGEAAQKWAAAEQPASFVEFFKGTFTRLGITVVETGEQFTVVHQGDRFAFEPGAKDVEVVVPVTQHNVDDLLARAGDGTLDDDDAYDIMSVLFTPLTREVLKHPVSADNNLRQLAGVEQRMHIVLLAADGSDGATHTLVYDNGTWDVLGGLQGTAQRTFRMTPAQAIDYQRHAYEALRANSPAGWTAFSTWYKRWRETCSSTTAPA